MIRGVLLDLDGLIVDTEPIHFLAFRAFVRDHGHELPESVMPSFVGYDEIENMRELKEKYQIPGNIQDMLARRRAYYVQFLQTEPIPVLPGFWEFSAECRHRRIKQAVVSSSTRLQVEIPLRRIFADQPHLGDPFAHFDAIVTGDDVTKSKPDPEPYSLGAQRLGLPPGECLAFEDTPPGVLSAAAAGAVSYAIPNEYSKHLEFPKAQGVIASLHDAIPLLNQT